MSCHRTLLYTHEVSGPGGVRDQREIAFDVARIAAR
jgi:hypothetical protein